MIGRYWDGTFNCPASTCWIINCALAHNAHVNKSQQTATFIRSFVCNRKRPSVKQSIKWQVSSHFQIYPGKTDEPSLPPSPPFETARVLSKLYTFQCHQWVPIWNSQLIRKYKEIPVQRKHADTKGRWTPLPPSPPFETARVLSKLYAFQCLQ